MPKSSPHPHQVELETEVGQIVNKRSAPDVQVKGNQQQNVWLTCLFKQAFTKAAQQETHM
jgi:hypothetical protein